jgi:hypothetical protein
MACALRAAARRARALGTRSTAQTDPSRPLRAPPLAQMRSLLSKINELKTTTPTAPDEELLSRTREASMHYWYQIENYDLRADSQHLRLPSGLDFSDEEDGDEPVKEGAAPSWLRPFLGTPRLSDVGGAQAKLLIPAT